MSAETKNILIEVTAVDEQRALNTLNCLVSGFAIYNDKQIVTPVMEERTLTTNI